MRISDLSDRVGIPVSTVRYYERIGLMPPPSRTDSGYREYDDQSVTRLLFVTRARHLGLCCEQIAELLPIWDGTNCSAAQGRVVQLIEEKQQEIAQQVQELTDFLRQLDGVLADLREGPPPAACRVDLSCCVPAGVVENPLEPSRALPVVTR